MSEKRSTGDRLDERQSRRDGTSGETGGDVLHVPVNMYEADGAVVVIAPLPGVMESNVEVGLDGRTLSIKATMRAPAPKEYLVHEWHYGPYEREVELPEGFGGQPTISFGNGQLAVSIPRL